jgi:hypothetical protein
MDDNCGGARRVQRTVVEWLREITGGVGTESAKKTEAYALAQVMIREIDSGRAKWVDDFAREIVAPVRAFEHYGSSNFSQDCSLCRVKINRGEPVWFKREHDRQRSIAFHDECFDILRHSAKPSFPLYDALKADGLV